MAVNYKLGKVNICENQAVGGLTVSHALYDAHDPSGPTSFCIVRDPKNNDLLLPLCQKYGIGTGIDVKDKRIKINKDSPLELAINQSDFSEEAFGFQIDKLDKRALRTVAPQYMTLPERFYASLGKENSSIMMTGIGTGGIFGGLVTVIGALATPYLATEIGGSILGAIISASGFGLLGHALSERCGAPSLRKAVQYDDKRAKYVRALAHHIAKKEYALAQLNERLIEQKIKLDVSSSMPMLGTSNSLDALLAKRDGTLVAKMKDTDQKRATLISDLSPIYDAFAMLTVGEEFWKQGAALIYESQNPEEVRAFITEVGMLTQQNVSPIMNTPIPLQLERVDSMLPPQIDGSSQITT